MTQRDVTTSARNAIYIGDRWTRTLSGLPGVSSLVGNTGHSVTHRVLKRAIGRSVGEG